MEREKIIEKINKLLMLASKNTNQNEAAAAQAAAFRLMTENSISIAEVNMPGTEKARQAEYNSQNDYQASSYAEEQRRAQEQYYQQQAAYEAQRQREQQARYEEEQRRAREQYEQQAAYEAEQRRIKEELARQQAAKAEEAARSKRSKMELLVGVIVILMILSYVFPNQFKVFVCIILIILAVNYIDVIIGFLVLYVLYHLLT